MLKVIDDYFPADLNLMINKGVERFEWTYGHKSDFGDPTHNLFFICHLWNIKNPPNFYHFLWKSIEEREFPTDNLSCRRIIANGQVQSQDGNIHTDYDEKTVLYYPLEWQDEWGGSSVYEVDGEEREVKYKQNRLVLFDADTPHLGRAPCVPNQLRVSIAFNLASEK